jgi:hypothetical protein
MVTNSVFGVPRSVTWVFDRGSDNPLNQFINANAQLTQGLDPSKIHREMIELRPGFIVLRNLEYGSPDHKNCWI